MKLEFRPVFVSGNTLKITRAQSAAAVAAALLYFQTSKVDPAMAWNAVLLECDDMLPGEGGNRDAIQRLIDIWNRAESAAHCAAGLDPRDHMLTALLPMPGGQS